MGEGCNKGCVTECGYNKKVAGRGPVAEWIDTYRLFPRSYLVFWCYLSYEMVYWFMGKEDISTGQGAVLAAVVAAASFYGKSYSQHAPRGD